MVFPRSKREEQDPELLAEQELEKINGGSQSGPVKKLESDDTDMASHGSLSSISNAGSTEVVPPTVTKPSSSKETKAQRKKRCRGVSGSSIKKDGGRFDLGMEDFEDLDVEDYEDDEGVCVSSFSPNVPVVGTRDQPGPSRPSSEWQAAFLSVSERYHDYVKKVYNPIFFGEAKEDRMSRLHKELSILFEENYHGIYTTDNMAEFRLSVSIAQMIYEEGIVNYEYLNKFFWQSDHLRDHAMNCIRTGRKHMERFDNCPLIPQPRFPNMVVPPTVYSLAKDLCNEHQIREIAKELPQIYSCFHSIFVHETLSFAVNSMSMDVMFFVVSALNELYINQILSDISIRIGFCRLVNDIPELEKDLPAAVVLTHLLSSYAKKDLPVTELCFANLPEPKQFLSSVVGGKLYPVDPNEDSSLPPLSSENYFLMN